MKTILLGLLFTFYSCSLFAQGPKHALRFDGADDYVYFDTDNRGVTNEVTVEAWVKTTATKLQLITAKYDHDGEHGYQLVMRNGNAAFSGRDGSGNYRISGYSPAFIADNQWHHLAGVCKDGTWSIYVDGLLESRSVTGYTTTDLRSNVPFTVGNYYMVNYDFYQGEVDELKIWKRGFSADEIRAGMCHAADPSADDLVVYLKFDEGAGSTLEDLSPLHINGSFRNMNPATAWTLSGAPVGDKSVYSYPGTWNTPLELETGLATFSVVQAAPSIKGMHLYQVAAPPASSTGIANPAEVKEYYGVFKVGSATGKYKLSLAQDAISCSSTLFNRTDNTDPAWTVVADTMLSPVVYHTASACYGEYAFNSSSVGTLSIQGPSTLCTGTTATLSVEPAEGQVRWSNGATGNSIEITQGGTYEAVRPLNGCTSRSILEVREVAPPVVDLGPDTAACPGEVVILKAPEGSQGMRYRWSTGATTASIAVTTPGTYGLTVTNEAGCTASDEVVVSKAPTPAYVFPETVSTCYGQDVPIGTEVAGATYHWSTGQTTPTIRVSTPGTYEVFYTLQGCTYNFGITVTTDECPVIPNIITPNGDGRNDTFVVNGVELRTLRLELFNRWGKSVFLSEQYANDWAATGVPTGIYYYQLISSRTGKVYKGWLEVVK